tara:strand:- start:5994 stop:6551 length:558 start_codon:yes stop_codon:yes gene_type:complete
MEELEEGLITDKILIPFTYYPGKDLSPSQIAKKIIKLSGLDIYKNTRKKEYIEMRALVCFLFRDKLFMKWERIAQFFECKGKSMTHASAIHLVKNYPMYKSDNKLLHKFEQTFVFSSKIPYDGIDKVNYLENKYFSLEKKYLQLTQKLKNPLIKLVIDVEDKNVIDLIKRIKLIKSTYDWQNKSN